MDKALVIQELNRIPEPELAGVVRYTHYAHSRRKVFLVLESPAVKLVDKGHKANPAYRRKLLEVVELGGEVYACPYWGRKLPSWADPLVW